MQQLPRILCVLVGRPVVPNLCSFVLLCSLGVSGELLTEVLAIDSLLEVSADAAGFFNAVIVLAAGSPDYSFYFVNNKGHLKGRFISSLVLRIDGHLASCKGSTAGFEASDVVFVGFCRRRWIP
ncbi:hypothetical protein BC939DRAFT_481440 [Gamsiella multidivaricata]|uniref:uncharacterized protein n=1 Tax=Gamsiella multidivaricata TaxID=101098 RepID=UPI00221FECB2|nr:uncharacterized protein BC939DRAFT_481440 [Gamsiella multidivaricata]KAI7817123.1 hypothetical protein BC939DRAFT_481440 [Gamsiella multidivaricata]